VIRYVSHEKSWSEEKSGEKGRSKKSRKKTCQKSSEEEEIIGV